MSEALKGALVPHHRAPLHRYPALRFARSVREAVYSSGSPKSEEEPLSLHPRQTSKFFQLEFEEGWAGKRSLKYGQRALVETAMGRYKAIIGPCLRARSFSGQKAEGL
jgi:hypothetical protein